MAVGKEIRSKIGSIKNTQKITRAMEMVAASKMRKTKDRMLATRPYSKKISQIIKMHQIVVNNIVIDVVRKNIKNLHLAVYPPSGRLKQTLNISTPSSLNVRLSGLV